MDHDHLSNDGTEENTAWQGRVEKQLIWRATGGRVHIHAYWFETGLMGEQRQDLHQTRAFRKAGKCDTPKLRVGF